MKYSLRHQLTLSLSFVVLVIGFCFILFFDKKESRDIDVFNDFWYHLEENYSGFNSIYKKYDTPAKHWERVYKKYSGISKKKISHQELDLLFSDLLLNEIKDPNISINRHQYKVNQEVINIINEQLERDYISLHSLEVNNALEFYSEESSSFDIIKLKSLAQFDKRKSVSLQKNINKSKKEHIIIDLRNVNDGNLEQSLLFASIFAKKSLYFMTEYIRSPKSKSRTDFIKSNTKYEIKKINNNIENTKITILSSPLTSGSAEILIAALSSQENTNIIGQKTLGKFSKCISIPLNDRWKITIPNTLYKIKSKNISRGILPTHPLMLTNPYTALDIALGHYKPTM